MIGKPEWFTTRKYTGWGLSPATKEGWMYLGGIVIPLTAIQLIPSLELTQKNGLTYAWMALIALDVIDIMIKMKRDEREAAHEALAERNASWFIVITLAILMVVRSLQGATTDFGILAVILGGMLTKALTYWRLRNQ